MMNTFLNSDIITSILKLKDLIELLVVIIGVPLVFVQIFLLIKQLKLSILQSKEQTEWNKKDVTFQYVSKYTEELKDIKEKILQEIGVLGQNDSSISEEKLIELLKDSTLRADIMRILAYFDTLALGLRNDYFNNDIAEDSLIVMAIETYEALMPYIKIRREKYVEKYDVKIATNFENLYDEWKETITTKYQ